MHKSQTPRPGRGVLFWRTLEKTEGVGE